MRITVRHLKSIITEALAAPKGYAARKPAPKRSAAPKKPAPKKASPQKAAAKKPQPSKRAPRPQGVTQETMPKTLDAFRKWMSGIAKLAGAPDDLVYEIASEGSGVDDAVWAAWDDVSYYINDERDDDEALEALVSCVHDFMIDAVDQYNNGMNYAPGHKGSSVNAASLAKRADAIASGERPPEYEKSKHEMLDVEHIAAGVVSALKSAGIKARSVSKYASSDLRNIMISKTAEGKPPTGRKVWDAIRAAATGGKLGLPFKEPEPGLLKYEDSDSDRYRRYPPTAMIIVSADDRYSDDPLDDAALSGPASALTITVEVDKGSK